ncbi:MAG: hypothetical protein JSV62_07065 [Promethearchaeota archaeon]|nr:MAG: hypothetical protein JSV62_07065 [Candidatus Lokiarchaeota archaeon]
MAKKVQKKGIRQSASKDSQSKIKREEKEKKSSESEKKKEEKEYLTKEDLDLGIPVVPEAPKKSIKLALDTSKLSSDVIKRMKKFESPDVKVVLVNCQRCKAVIPVPVPKKAVLDSELPVVPISYVHKNLEEEDQHCLTVHIDHDFDIRRQRISDVVISSD